MEEKSAAGIRIDSSFFSNDSEYIFADKLKLADKIKKFLKLIYSVLALLSALLVITKLITN